MVEASRMYTKSPWHRSCLRHVRTSFCHRVRGKHRVVCTMYGWRNCDLCRHACAPIFPRFSRVERESCCERTKKKKYKTNIVGHQSKQHLPEHFLSATQPSLADSVPFFHESLRRPPYLSVLAATPPFHLTMDRGTR